MRNSWLLGVADGGIQLGSSGLFINASTTSQRDAFSSFINLSISSMPSSDSLDPIAVPKDRRGMLPVRVARRQERQRRRVGGRMEIAECRARNV